MSGPYEQAGAVREPSEYATLSMDRAITGLWTQRSPLRDAAVPYLYVKFYSANRFDSLIDGINREITARLTYARRPGSSVWNALTFPAINSFYSYKYIQGGTEFVRVIADGQDGNVYDATPGQKTTLFAKSSGAGKSRFLGLSTELFFCDGVDAKKWLTPGVWTANTNVEPGTLITVGAEPGTVQMALGGMTLPIVASSMVLSGSSCIYTIYVDPQQIPLQFPNLQNVWVVFSGLSAAFALNGVAAFIQPVSATLGILTVEIPNRTSATAYTETTDTGSGTTGNGTTGLFSPVGGFSATEFNVTQDAGQQWKNYGPAVQNWGLKASLKTPVLAPLNGSRFWQPNTVLEQYYSVLDPSGNVEVAIFAGGAVSGVPYRTGLSYPQWGSQTLGNAIYTNDGSITWLNYGPIGVWQKSFTFPGDFAAILDSNNNLQILEGLGGTTGTTVPTWATAFGALTADGSLASWRCLGPGVVVTYNGISYAFSTHGVDGSVSTASPVASIQGGIFGKASGNGPYLSVSGSYDATDTQIDQLYIGRTAQGQATLILEDQLPVDFLAGSFTYYELGIPDTSTNGGAALDALIPLPVASANNPPPSNISGPVYHLRRVWAFYDNYVVYSGGPDTVTGNGNTAWPPLNYIPFPEKVIRLMPFTFSNSGVQTFPTLLVFTTTNVYVIAGTGTQANPFYPAIFAANVGLLNYDALDVVGSTVYLFTGKSKFGTLDSNGNWAELGFAIGDQFQNVTTGAGSAVVGALYSPAGAYVTWHEQSSGDTAIYVSDGSVGWFRLSPVATPESGYLWSPRAAIVGGTSAVQSVETSPGQSQLLIGPPIAGGPILFRDATVNTDFFYEHGHYVYPAWHVKGNIVLCQSGEVAEDAHIALKSLRVGAQPVVSVLMGEIAATPQAPWVPLAVTSNDPPDLQPSATLYSDRYALLQNASCPKCDHFQMKVDYGSQNVADELLMFSVYGAKHAERKQQ
jgi:hypothetical protein